MTPSSSGYVSRLAPTPSGFLHMGNAYNFLLTWWAARWSNGTLWLRIDDADTGRRREEFVEDIFDSIAWLGIDYDRGPKNLHEFHKSFSQELKKEDYLRAALSLKETFPCDCSRKEIMSLSPTGTYMGTCREKNNVFERYRCSLRFKTPEDANIKDFILWRKDDVPAYQLTSVVDDYHMGVNLIIRGEDLLDSSQAQIILAKALGFKTVETAFFFHHTLLKNAEGKKLAKSGQHSDDPDLLVNLRKRGKGPEELLKLVERHWSLPAGSIRKPQDLLKTKPPFLD